MFIYWDIFFPFSGLFSFIVSSCFIHSLNTHNLCASPNSNVGVILWSFASSSSCTWMFLE